MSVLVRPVCISIYACLAFLFFGTPMRADDKADEVATVPGTVTVDGRALTSGRIFFMIGEDQFVGAKVKDGKYKIDRVPVGPHVVAFEYEDVPAMYADKSALTADVTPGKNHFDFVLGLK